MAEEPSAPHLLLTASPVAVPGHGVLFSGSGGRVRIEGPTAVRFASTLALLADGTRTATQVMEGLLDLSAEGVDRWMADLVQAGSLIQVRPMLSDQGHLLAALGVRGTAGERLETTTIAIVGSDPITDEVARLLRAFGASEILVVPVGADESIASRDELGDMVRDCKALVASLLPGRLGAAHWANLVALDNGIPAVFGSADGATGWAGPLVFPGEGPCLLCYRMRAAACEDDFDDAMATEEWLAGRQSRSALVPLETVSAAVAGIMAVEMLKTLTAVGSPSTVGAVWEIDGLSHNRRLHRFLQRQDCPACQKKDRPPRLPDDQGDGPVDLERLELWLVSSHCGIVRKLETIPSDVSEPAVTVVRCELSNNQFRGPDQGPFQPCSGKGTDQRRAMVTALGEACERYSAAAWLSLSVRRVSARDVGMDYLGPLDLVLFAEDQYEDLPYCRWDADAVIGWVDGRELATGAPVAVPAVAALFGYEGSAADHLFAPTSNGLAAGRSFAAAATAAALEVVERDAFLVSWMHRLACTRVDPFSVDDPSVRRLAESYRRRDISLELYRLPTDVEAVTVFAAMGVQQSDRAVGPGPAALLGLGADLSATAAAAKAVLEVAQVRPSLKARLRSPTTVARCAELAADPSLVASLEDHDLLYAHPDTLGWLGFWRDQAPVSAEPAVPSPSEDEDRLQALLDSLASAGHRLVACDLTPPELANMGVHTARAVIPGFQPIHFGTAEVRLGGRRLYDLPCQIGLRPSPASREHLSTLPHPLA